MKVILRADIVNIGRQGDIKDIAPGFARNFLLPKKLVMEASPQNLKVWEREKSKLEAQREEIISKAQETAAKLEAEEFAIAVKIGENGKIFGSVTTAIIAKELAAKGYEISKKDILLADNIKEVGIYEIAVRIHPQVHSKIKVNISGGK
ncbi:MAG: 50S ribosomal protein L9 [Elusimicrobiota bacterium]|jgi:large subunit ribosomal protein L9|nr:50S ribosomal protein L9 [Elusimicrobiota bacterium]